MVEKLYGQMTDVLTDNQENGLDSPAFRKLKYRVALLNEFQFGSLGFPGIVSLIAENPGYNKYHLALRQMLVKRKAKIEYGEGESNPLLDTVFNSEVSDTEFLDLIKEERSQKSIIWLKYKRIIQGLKLTEN